MNTQATITINNIPVTITFTSATHLNMVKDVLMKKVRDTFTINTPREIPKTTGTPKAYTHTITEKQLIRSITMRMAKESAMAGKGSFLAKTFIDKAKEELKSCRV